MIEFILVFSYFVGLNFEIWLWVLAGFLFLFKLIIWKYGDGKIDFIVINVLDPMIIVAGLEGESPFSWWMWVIVIGITMFVHYSKHMVEWVRKVEAS